MPVLPNPDPQVWRMLLGEKVGEILGAPGNAGEPEEKDRDRHSPESEIKRDGDSDSGNRE